MSHPFLEGLQLGRCQVSWLAGLFGAPSRGPEGSQWLRGSALGRPRCDELHPVTVAGPRRFLTGLP